MDQEQRLELQRQMLKSFKDGMKSTFQEELNRITVRYIFGQSGTFILHYALYRAATLFFL